MALHLITGPPNSGRTEKLRDLIDQAKGRSPILVVPSVSDVFSWERRLTDSSGASIGVRVLHFRDLCVEVIRRSGRKRKPLLSDLRRGQIMAQVVRREWPGQADRLRNQPGFLDSLLDLVDDFRTEQIITPEELRSRLARAELSGLEGVKRLFEGYLEALERSGGQDEPALVSTAVQLLADPQIPGVWTPGSPLFLAGFDDLTGQQSEMVRKLAVERGVDVTIAITSEPDNPGTAVSNELVGRLKEYGKACGIKTDELVRDEVVVAPLLDQIARRFLRPPEEGQGPLVPDDSVTLIEAAGVRNEAEAIGSEIAQLVASEVDPGSIGISVGSPGTEGRLIREILERYGIPVALEAEIPARATIVGSSIAALIRAVLEDSVDDLLYWLRSPLGPPREVVDLLEFYCRKDSEASANEATGRLSRLGGAAEGWDDLIAIKDGGLASGEIIGDLTDRLADRILDADPARPPSPGTVLELRVAGALNQALAELGDLEGDGKRQLEALLEAIDNDAIKIWSSPSGDAVTIASPYGMRAKRFRYLFMAGLQEAASHDPERPGPFLSRENRRALGMSVKVDREDQERYLFYSCLTVPTDRLWLSFTTSDETGKSVRPSPLVGLIEAMFPIDPETGVSTLRRVTRSGRTPVFPMSAAPMPEEVARTAAAGFALPGSISGSSLGGKIEAALATADKVMSRTASLASLANEDLKRKLAGEGILSPTRIEAWVTCPYRWYVEKAIQPDRFGPDSDYLTLGSVLHKVLEEVYGKKPGTRPDQENLSAWLGDLEACLDQVLGNRKYGLTGRDIRSEVLRLRIRRLAESLIRSEAAHPRDSFVPELLECDFGPIDMGPTGIEKPEHWSLTGKIDRIDLAGPDEDHEDGRVLVIDYKSGSVEKYARAKALDKGLIQMILYLVATRSIEKLGGATPVGGIYLPVSGKQGRGGLESKLKSSSKTWHFVKNEAEGDFEAWLDAGLALAEEGARGILHGVLDHDPATCRDHFEHAAVPDWTPGFDGDGEAEV